jgi:hypothetical protein
MNAALAAALGYADGGWRVFPAHRTIKKSLKAARHSDGRRWGASRDRAEICADFNRWPRARIGIVTGAESGIVVIDRYPRGPQYRRRRFSAGHRSNTRTVARYAYGGQPFG